MTARRLTAACAIAWTVFAGAATGARAGSFAGGFAAAPVGAGASGYFSLKLPPGKGVIRTVRISNLSATPQTLDLYAVQGVTSPSSGDVYTGRPGRCTAAACWITGLPARLTLAAGQARDVAFTVHLSAAATPGQYLAGVAVQPSDTTASSLGPGARSVIVHEVVVGVAVTTGSYRSSQLSVSAVTGAQIGGASGIAVTETNRGRQFEHPSGTVTLVGHGVRRSFALRSGTVLPGGRATLSVVTRHVAPRSYRAQVTLTYDGGARTAHWRGRVAIPAPRPVPITAVNQSVRTPAVVQRPAGSSPILLVGIGLAGALVVAAALLLLRRRRGRWAVTDATASPDNLG